MASIHHIFRQARALKYGVLSLVTACTWTVLVGVSPLVVLRQSKVRVNPATKVVQAVVESPSISSPHVKAVASHSDVIGSDAL